MKSNQKGLTMVNQMIMVAFIGILPAVVLPAYGEYNAHAKATQASTQLDGQNMSSTELYISLTTGFF